MNAKKQKSQQKKRRFLNDFILLAAVLVISAAAYLFFNARTTSEEIITIEFSGNLALDGNHASDQTKMLSLKNEGYYNIEFPEDYEGFTIEGAFTELVDAQRALDCSEYNILCIENGKARVAAASCPDLICVHTRSVSAKGEQIVCLPHRLIITTGSQSNTKGEALDAVTW